MVGVIEMEKDEYERQKRGLYYLRKLSKMDKIIPLAIWLLGRELDVKGVGERKGIDIEYNMLTGDLKIKVCGDDIIEKYIIEHKPHFLEKEKISAVLDSILSEEILKRRYEL